MQHSPVAALNHLMQTRIRKFLILFTAILLTAAPLPGHADKAEEYYGSAVTYFHSGAYTSARIELQNALQLQRRHLGARMLLGQVELQLGQPVAAEAQLQLARDFGGDADLIMPALGEAWLILGKTDDILEYEEYRDFSNKNTAIWRTVRGRAYLQLQDYPSAIDEFNSALKLDSSLAGAAAGIGSALLAQGKVDEAGLFAAQALELEPDSDHILKLSGDVAMHMGDDSRALEFYRRAIDLDRENLGARQSRAAILIAREDYTAAEQDIDYILERNPQDARGVINKAQLLARQNKNKEAQQLMAEFNFHLSGIDDPKLKSELDFKLLRGLTLYLQGSPEQALPYLKDVNRAYPEKRYIRQILTDAYARSGRYKAVVEIYENVNSVGQSDIPYIYTYARAAWALNRYAEAERKLAEWAEQNPTLFSELSKLLAVSLLGRGKHDEAQAIMLDEKVQEVVTLNSLLLLGTIQLEQTMLDDALVTAKELVSSYGQDAKALNFSCLVYKRLQEYQRALKLCGRAIQADPQHPGPVVNLALVQMEMGDYEKAIYGFNAVLTMYPQNQQALGGLAYIARIQGKWEMAMRFSERLTALNPRDIAYRLQLAGDLLRMGRPEAALAEADKAENISPLDARAMRLRAEAYKQLGDIDSAAAQLRYISGEYATTNPAALEGIAREQLAMDLIEDAEATIRRIRDTTEDETLAGVLEAESHYRAGDAEGCIKLLTPFAQDTASSLLARCYVDNGQQAVAAELYDRLLREQPTEQLAIERFQILLRSGQRESATSGLTEFLAENPDSPRVVKTLADFASTYDLGQAETRYRQLLNKWPDHAPAEVNNNLANLMLLRGGKDAEALKLAEYAYALNPDNAGISDTLGWALVRNDRAGDGLKYLREAYFRESRSTEIRFHLTVALADQGRREEANTYAAGIDRGQLTAAQLEQLDASLRPAVN
tara:strand:- start:39052 stop:41889 length:2838 start_codon:yes stop_codon:yes gene_type:complete